MPHSTHSMAPLNWCSKGLPASSADVPLADIRRQDWNVLREDLLLPVAVLHESAIRHNSAWMKEFTRLAGVQLCPHGKTTMSPELIDLQLAEGAWGITAATVGHVRIYRKHGVQRILLANQLIGRQNIEYVLDELDRDPSFDFYCLVDSLDGVAILETAIKARSSARPLQVLVELGVTGGRCGARSEDEALAVAARVASSPFLSLRGLEAFEGVLAGTNASSANGAVEALLQRIVEVATSAFDRDMFDGPILLTAGGSAYFDLAASILAAVGPEHNVVLRSGWYLVHDSGWYRSFVEALRKRSSVAAQLADGLRPALELWAYVHSRPEPTRVIVGLGKRDTSADLGMPLPLRWSRPGPDITPLALPEGHTTIRLDDQHAYLDVPQGSPLRVGDMLGFGISHPCTTFDRWSALYTVDDRLNVTGAIRTFF